MECQEKLSAVPQGSEDHQRQERDPSFAQAALKASSASFTVGRVLISLQASCLLHGSALSMCLSQLTSLCQSAQVHKSGRKGGSPLEGFWCASLYGVPTSGAKLCSVRRANTCVSSAKNPSSCVLALAEHPLSCVCFSQTFLHKSVLVFHLCPLLENAIRLNCRCQRTMWKTFLSGFLCVCPYMLI